MRARGPQAAPAQPPKLAEPAAAAAEAAARPEAADAETLLLTVAPKKPNWDLKRDIAPKLERLERRTQKALVRIMRAELAAEAAGGGGQE